jgi:hypothetical protein
VVAGNHLFAFRLLAIALVPMLIAYSFHRADFRWELSPEELLFLGFAAYLTFLLAFSPSLGSGLRAAAIILLPIGAGIAVATSVQRQRTLEIIFAVFFGVLCLSLVIAMWEVGTGNHLPTSRIPSLPSYLGHRATAWYHNSNDFSAFLAILSPLVAIKILYGTRVEQAFSVVVGACIGVVMYQNAPRAALLGAIAAITTCVLLFLLRRPLKRATNGFSNVLLVAPLLATVVVVGAVILIGGSFPIGERSIAARWQLFRIAVGIATETPFGAGLGGFTAVVQDSSLTTFGILSPHSWLTWLLGATGLLGTTLFVVLLGLLLKKNVTGYLEGEAPICLAVVGQIVAFSIAGIGPSNIFYMEGIWLLFGLLVAVSRTVQTQPDV